LPSFIPKVVEQLSVNLKRIHGLGVKKVAVAGLQPLGCLPRSTVTSSFRQCNGTVNSLVNFHNLLLKQAVAQLNNETKDSTFVILDLYASYTSVIDNKGDSTYISFNFYAFDLVNLRYIAFFFGTSRFCVN